MCQGVCVCVCVRVCVCVSVCCVTVCVFVNFTLPYSALEGQESQGIPPVDSLSYICIYIQYTYISTMYTVQELMLIETQPHYTSCTVYIYSYVYERSPRIFS